MNPPPQPLKLTSCIQAHRERVGQTIPDLFNAEQISLQITGAGGIQQIRFVCLLDF